MNTELDLANSIKSTISSLAPMLLGKWSIDKEVFKAYWKLSGGLTALGDMLICGFTKDALSDTDALPKYTKIVGKEALKAIMNSESIGCKKLAQICLSNKPHFHLWASNLFRLRLECIAAFFKENKNVVSGKYFLAQNVWGGKIVFTDDLLVAATESSFERFFSGFMIDFMKDAAQAVKMSYPGNPYQRGVGDPTPSFDFLLTTGAMPMALSSFLKGTPKDQFVSRVRNWMSEYNSTELVYEKLANDCRTVTATDDCDYLQAIRRALSFFESEKNNPDKKAARLKLKLLLQVGYGLIKVFERGEYVKGDGFFNSVTRDDLNRYWIEFSSEPEHESKG